MRYMWKWHAHVHVLNIVMAPSLISVSEILLEKTVWDIRQQKISETIDTTRGKRLRINLKNYNIPGA